MKIFYWSPFFTKVATISAVLNSAESLMRYKKKNDYEVTIINAIGEWNDYKKEIDKSISIKDIVKLTKKLCNNNTTKLNFGKIPMRKNEALQVDLNLKKLFKLKWKPKYSIENSLKKTIDYYNK